MARDMEMLLATVDFDEQGQRHVFAERVPDHVFIVQELFEDMDDAIIQLEGNADDGYRAVFTFDNGRAVYALQPAKRRKLWAADLLTWEPR